MGKFYPGFLDCETFTIEVKNLSLSLLFTELASADNKGSLIFKTQSSKLVANLFIGCIWYRNNYWALGYHLHHHHCTLMGGYFIFLTSFYFSHNTDGLATCHGESGVFTTLLNIYSFSLRKIKIIEIRGLIMI